MAPQTQKEEFQLHPTDYQNAPSEEVFRLSDPDHIMPKMYVQIALVFELEANANKTKVVESLKAGLELTLSQFPVLAGTLQMEKDGKLWVLKKKTDTVGLIVKHLDGQNNVFPSFQELQDKHFPAALIDGNALLPESVTAKSLFSPYGDNRDKDILISVFQLNFIRGGLIICLAVHHSYIPILFLAIPGFSRGKPGIIDLIKRQTNNTSFFPFPQYPTKSKTETISSLYSVLQCLSSSMSMFII